MSKKIIIGDFSGIQNYLFDIRKNKSATKRLKGRSVFIEMLLEKIKENLKQKLGNCEDYLVSGGKFILIFEDFDEGKFNEFKKDIEIKLFKQFYGELKIIFGLADWKEGESFKNALNQAYEKVEKNKLRAFETVLIDSRLENQMSSDEKKWNENMFVFGNGEGDNGFEEDRGPDKVCKFSRGDLIKVKKGVDGYIDDILGEENVEGIGLNTANDIIISNFVSDKKGGEKKITIFDEKIKINTKYQKYLPKNKDGKIKSFEDLAGESGFNKLAVLKGDIDNLGEIFQFGLKENDYKGNYEKLSTILDDFWKKELYDFIESNEKYKNKLYVVYAGGDDFVILGRWDLIIEFYRDLLKEFEKYLKNSEVDKILNGKTYKDIHFSGSINLFGAHDTFFTVVKQTDDLLEEAKEGNKNQVNIFGQVLENEEFINLFNEAKEFYTEFLETDIVSVGTLRFLLDIGRKIKLENELENGKDKDGNEVKFFEYGLWNSELFYHLGRNYKKDEKLEFRNYINGMLLHNGNEEFKSLNGNDDLFEKNKGEKLIIMMSLLLYWKRDKN